MTSLLNSYLLASLPDLGEFASTPAISTAELLATIPSESDAFKIAAAIALNDDLLQRDSILAGQPLTAAPAVLSANQIAGQSPLPEFLAADAASLSATRAAIDSVWSEYFRYVVATAEETKCDFLADWAENEVTLRNEMTDLRCQALEIEPVAYLAAADLAGSADELMEAAITEWHAAANPLDAMAIIDRYKFDWATDRQKWYTYAGDEIAAYTTKLTILCRWRRINKDQER